MAGIVQGLVYRCDFGPILGRELSGRRRALVLSSDEVHELTGAAIVVPTSGQSPPDDVPDWHRPVADAGSWASVRQFKTVPVSLLNPRHPEGEATRGEFDDIRQRIMLRLLTAVLDRRFEFGGVEIPMRPGTVLTMRAYSRSGAEYLQRCLVCNYNGNGIANAFAISSSSRPNSRVAVEVAGPDGPLTVLPHQVRSVDLLERVVSVDCVLDPWDIIWVTGRFFDMIAWQRD